VGAVEHGCASGDVMVLSTLMAQARDPSIARQHTAHGCIGDGLLLSYESYNAGLPQIQNGAGAVKPYLSFRAKPKPMEVVVWPGAGTGSTWAQGSR